MEGKALIEHWGGTTTTIDARTVHYVDSSAVSQSRTRLREKMDSDGKLTQKCDTIVKQLIEMSR